MDTVANRLKTAMEMRNMRNRDIVEKSRQLGHAIGSNAVSQWLSGKYEPKQDKIVLLSRILDVPELWLMGVTDNMDRGAEIMENELLDVFRLLNQHGKDVLLELATAMHESVIYTKS